MTASICQECGRANGAAARLCIWCGAPMNLPKAGANFEAAQLEVEYLKGIERLDDPTPVRLAVGPAGVEVSELLPGSRTVRIPSEELVDARVVDASLHNTTRQSFIKRMLGTLAHMRQERGAGTQKTEYRLIIRYRKDGEIREAVFRREDQPGLSGIKGLAKVVLLLVKRRAGQKT